MVGKVKPGYHILPLFCTKRFPEHIGCQEKPIGYGCHLDEALVVVSAASPERRRGRICSSRETTNIGSLEEAVLAPSSAMPEWRKSPERTCPCFDGNGLLLVERRSAHKIYPRAVIAEVRL